MKVRKKPVVVDAVQWFKQGDHPAVTPIPHHLEEYTPALEGATGYIVTLEGGHFVTAGDWIVTGVEGEKYPCKPSVFNKTYEILAKPLAKPVVRACLIGLGRSGHVEPNLFCQGQFFPYSTKGTKADRKPLLLNYCPVCGLKITTETEEDK